jgi:hypothetical protein
MEDGVVVGGCTTTSSIAGIPQITGPAKEAIRDKAERKRLLVLLQDGGRLGVAAVMKDCEHILGSKTAQKVLASITLVVADDDDFENVPIVADATVK